MNSTTPEPIQSENQPQYDDRREARRQRLEERRLTRGSRSGAGWVLGAILIVIGLITLLQNWGIVLMNNWWALFILIPALGSFAGAWRSYQNASQRLTAAGRSSLIAGFILTMIAVIFLFNLDWGYLGPILLILAGAGILVNIMLPS